MEEFNFSSESIVNILKIISAVLKLGNLVFISVTNIDGTEGCAISNEHGKRVFINRCHAMSNRSNLRILIYFLFSFRNVRHLGIVGHQY